MTNSLKILASLGCLLAGCDATSVDPIQLSTKTTVGIGGGTAATGGASTTAKGGTGPATGGAISSTPPRGGSGTGGSNSTSSGTGGTTTYSSCLIIPNADTGWVDGTKNDCKIQGAWYSYYDCDTSPDDCTQNFLPLPKTGFSNLEGVMCTSGTTVPTGKDYTKKWGAGIGLNLNQQPSSEAKNPISALPPPTRIIKGFSFTLKGEVVPGKIHVNFPTLATADAAHFKEITAPGDYQALFSEAAQPGWVTTPTALVWGDVVSVEFQVAASETESVPFNFCVEKLSALY